MQQKRPFPPFRPPTPPEPPPPPSQGDVLRQRLGRFYARFHIVFLIVAVIVIPLAVVRLYDATKPPPQHLTQRDIDAAVERSLATATPKPSFASQVYEIIRPSLVQVQAQLAEKEGKPQSALGAGVIVDDRGTILTSLHIVRNATSVRVTFADGSESEATVIAAQAENDLAVLQPSIIPDDVVPATLGGGLRVGDEVFAVGNPFGMSNSLSAGVVSGLGRSFKSAQTGSTLTGLIQFDAAVNSGNSGGPLLNRDGEVVGVVTALLNPTEQDVFIGIGFAVPMETAGGLAGAPPV